MGFLIDTNVLSELPKQARADPGVARWHARVRGDDRDLKIHGEGDKPRAKS